jgi:protein-L-isoaspartate(D-aspartate) O-methyltransferase
MTTDQVHDANDLQRDAFANERRTMVSWQIAGRGIRDERVLEAMRAVPRERFVTPECLGLAYTDGPLPIGAEQTISQPYVVARMAALAELVPESRVLEVGAGSGYAAAVLGRIAREVFAIEWHAPLAERAARTLADLGYDNVHVKHGDGRLGWPEHAPFDAIIVSAGARDVPEDLKTQLVEGGRLVLPLRGGFFGQRLVRIRRTGRTSFHSETLEAVRFVPLLGGN